MRDLMLVWTLRCDGRTRQTLATGRCVPRATGFPRIFQLVSQTLEEEET